MSAQIHQLLLHHQVELAIQLARQESLQEGYYYLLRFGEILDELRNSEWIDLLEFSFHAPQLEDIIKIEQQIKKPLHPNTRIFYEQCNGITLRWLDKRNEHYEMLKYNNQNNEDVDGCINIKGIDDIYNKNALDSYGSTQDLMDKTLDSEEIAATYHLFDGFSSFNDIMAYTGEGYEDNPLLIMGDDHQACYTDARLLDLPSYLELVFYCGGAVEGRRKFLKKYEGHLLPILKLNKTYFEQFPKADFSQYPAKFGFPEVRVL